MKRFLIYPAAVFAILLCGCRGSNYETYSGYAQGTTYRIVVNSDAEGLGERIDSVFHEIDNTFSMFNPESLVSRINRNETDLTTPLFDRCFAIARDVWQRTGGYYDITVKPLVDAWGFGPGEQQAEPDIAAVMQYVGMDKVRIADGRLTKDDPRLQLDFSSVAKGLTVDCLAAMLEEAGASDYMVDVGGEMRVRGVNAAGKSWRIGINRPEAGMAQEVEVVAVFDGAASAIATSGNYRNRFVDEQGHTRVHTIDATTGLPAIGSLLSVSIVGPSCGVADAFATGLMASGSIDRAASVPLPEGLEYFIIYTGADGAKEISRTAGFPLSNE